MSAGETLKTRKTNIKSFESWLDSLIDVLDDLGELQQERKNMIPPVSFHKKPSNPKAETVECAVQGCGEPTTSPSGICPLCQAEQEIQNQTPPATKPEANDGSNAGTSHYDLPAGATELKHLIWYKDMNAQEGEMFRSIWRLGTAGHSSRERDLRKIIAYAEQELERMQLYPE